MKVLVTGATGYVGSHIVNKLISNGYVVHVLVRSISEAKIKLPSSVILFEGDIINISSIQKAMSGCDIVFHLAAFAKVYAQNSSDYFKINAAGTKNVLDIAKKLQIKKVIMTSTAGVFGPSFAHKVDENSVRDIDFFNEYESSKAISELIAKNFFANGLDVVILSPTRIYGPYLNGKSESITLLIEKFIKAKWRLIPGDGSKIGNYVYIEDVVKAHINAITYGKPGHVYLIAGENKSYEDFFNSLKKISGRKRKMIHVPDIIQTFFARLQMIKILFGKDPLITTKWTAKGKYNWEVNNTKMINELKIHPVEFEEGLTKTIIWLNKR